MKEIWKEIDGYDGFYEISNLGRCKTHYALGSGKYTEEGRIIKPVKCSNGYLEYQLRKDGKRKCHMAHRLVAQAFIPNPDNKEEVNHIDECITNNKVDNLEWVTPKENCNYGTRNKRSIENHKYNKIIQLTLEGEYIATHNDAKEASKVVGLTGSSCIIRCCKGENKQSKGYKWMYEKDYLNKVTLGEVTA